MTSLVIVGPTASGKSALAMEIASRTPSEIVSIDSRQVYIGLDIGTAKPSREERERVPHHMIDILDIREKTDAKWFAALASDAVERIESRDRVPILVGGSGLYLKAVLEGFFEISLDPEERQVFASSVGDLPTEELFGSLERIDPVSAARIHPNDRYRIVRALEVHSLTGKTLTEHFTSQKTDRHHAGFEECLKIGIDLDRETLRRSIMERTRAMFESGWPEEVETLLKAGVDSSWYGMKSLGYPEVVAYVRGETGREEAIRTIATRTGQYAKRQMTWFRKEKGVNWVSSGGTSIIPQALKLLDSSGWNW